MPVLVESSWVHWNG